MGAQTYAALFAETRNIGGLIGDGSQAAADGAAAVSRLRTVDGNQPLPNNGVRDLEQVFDRIDARLVAVFEHGVHERLYFIKAKVPRIDDRDGSVVHGVRERFMPITSPVETDLVHLIHERLRPRPECTAPPPSAAKSRRDFEEAITHQPAPKGVRSDGPSL